MLHTCASCSTVYAAGLEACPNCSSTERTESGGSTLPALAASCRTDGCVASGQSRQVILRQVALGVLHVPQELRCASCFANMEVESLLPKITRHGGPSIASEAPKDANPPQEPTPAVENTPQVQEDPEPEADAKPAPKRRARKADAEASIQVTAEAQVTGPDGTVR